MDAEPSIKVEFTRSELNAIFSAIESVDFEYGFNIGPRGTPELYMAARKRGEDLIGKLMKAVNEIADL